MGSRAAYTVRSLASWQTVRVARAFGQAAALALMAAITSPLAHAQKMKLYLKDGSYDLVKTYQIQGERIRFYNLDTSEWEEMPLSLVDFDATKRAQQQEAITDEKNLDAAETLEKERFDPSINPSGFQVAPGRFLPLTEGVYAFDGMRVIPLVQSEGEIVTDKERMVLNLALPGPLLKKRALVSLPGPEAAVRIANPQSVFYIQSNDGWGSKAEIIPVKEGRNSRVVEKIQSGVGAGAAGELRSAVPMTRTTVAKGIIKLQPTKPLEPGEYAIGKLVDGKLNLDVWDFGIDRPGKKPAAVAADSGQEPAMSEDRPGETRKQTTPVDMIPGIPHPGNPQASPSGPPLPGPASDGSPPAPSNPPASSGPPN